MMNNSPLIARLQQAIHTLESFIAKADEISSVLESGQDPEQLKTMCDSLLSNAREASQANQDIEIPTNSDPALTRLETQRSDLIREAQAKHDILKTTLDALVAQTRHQMQAIKAVMAQASDTYSSLGKPVSGSASRTLSKA